MTGDELALWEGLERNESDAAFLVAADWYAEHPDCEPLGMEFALRWAVAAGRRAGRRTDVVGYPYVWLSRPAQGDRHLIHYRLGRTMPRAVLGDVVMGLGLKVAYYRPTWHKVAAFNNLYAAYHWLATALFMAARELRVPSTVMPVAPGEA